MTNVFIRVILVKDIREKSILSLCNNLKQKYENWRVQNGIRHAQKYFGFEYKPAPEFKPSGKNKHVGTLDNIKVIDLNNDFYSDLMWKSEKYGPYKIDKGTFDFYPSATKNIECRFGGKYFGKFRKLLGRKLTMRNIYVFTTDAVKQEHGITKNQENPYVEGGNSIEYIPKIDIQFNWIAKLPNILCPHIFYDVSRGLNTSKTGEKGAYVILYHMNMFDDMCDQLNNVIASVIGMNHKKHA